MGRLFMEHERNGENFYFLSTEFAFSEHIFPFCEGRIFDGQFRVPYFLFSVWRICVFRVQNFHFWNSGGSLFHIQAKMQTEPIRVMTYWIKPQWITCEPVTPASEWYNIPVHIILSLCCTSWIKCKHLMPRQPDSPQFVCISHRYYSVTFNVTYTPGPIRWLKLYATFDTWMGEQLSATPSL